MRAAAVMCLILVWCTSVAKAAGEAIYIIADSVSTSLEARRIARAQTWIEVPLRQAHFALVVVRSSLERPLTGIYDDIGELKKDAEMQLNISGPNFVVYLFSLDDDLRPTELKRISYPAED